MTPNPDADDWARLARALAADGVDPSLLFRTRWACPTESDHIGSTFRDRVAVCFQCGTPIRSVAFPEDFARPEVTFPVVAAWQQRGDDAGRRYGVWSSGGSSRVSAIAEQDWPIPVRLWAEGGSAAEAQARALLAWAEAQEVNSDGK